MNRAPTMPQKNNRCKLGSMGLNGGSFPDELSAMEGKSSTNCASARIEHYGPDSCLFVKFVVSFPGGAKRYWRGGAGGIGYKKRRAAEVLCSAALRRGRLPTLPLSQYHRRGEA